MKLKAKKHHYHDGVYTFPGQTYMTDKLTGESRVKNGICEEVKLPSRTDKIAEKKETKMEPKAKIIRKKRTK